MEIISREVAIAQGLHRFYTGEPCRNGHDSERFVSSRGCIACQKEYQRKKYMELRNSRVKRLHKHKNRHTGTGLKIEKGREERNGVTRPSVGGKCRAVWDLLDKYRDQCGELPTAQVVRQLADEEGWNANNAAIEFYNWRKFHGITGRNAA